MDHLSKLKIAALAGNLITKIENLDKCTNIESLILSNCLVMQTGTIFPKYKTFTTCAIWIHFISASQAWTRALQAQILAAVDFMKD